MTDHEKKIPETETKESNQEPVKTWRCDTYCRKVRHVSCEGEGHVVADSPNLCPYLDEMLY